MTREDGIKLIAYRLWENDGCCHGKDVEHWVRAEVIWEAQQAPLKETNAQAGPQNLDHPESKAGGKAGSRPSKKNKPARR